MQGVAEPGEPRVDDNAPHICSSLLAARGPQRAWRSDQGNITSYLNFVEPRYAVNADDRCSQNFELTFDPSVNDLLFLLLGCRHNPLPCPEQYPNPVSIIKDKGLTV